MSFPEILVKLWEKDTCKSILKYGGIPIPEHLIIINSDTKPLQDIINVSTLTFPLILKPTNESFSNGIINEVCF